MTAQVRLAKVIMALRGQDPTVSDRDALSYIQYNKFDVTIGEDTITHNEILEIFVELGKPAPAPAPVGLSPDVGDKVVVKTEDGSVEGKVKEVKYIVSGLGNKHYLKKEVTKL